MTIDRPDEAEQQGEEEDQIQSDESDESQWNRRHGINCKKYE